MGRGGGDGSHPGGEKQPEGGGRGALAQLRCAEMDFATALLSLLTPFLDPRAPPVPAAAAQPGAGAKKRRHSGSTQASSAGGGSREPSVSAWCAAACGAAGVLESARVTGAYAPTEDAGGVQRAFLGAVAGVVVGAYSHLADGSGGGGGGDGGGDGIEGAAAAVVCAMLDLEHRWGAWQRQRGGARVCSRRACLQCMSQAARQTGAAPFPCATTNPGPSRRALTTCTA